MLSPRRVAERGARAGPVPAGQGVDGSSPNGPAAAAERGGGRAEGGRPVGQGPGPAGAGAGPSGPLEVSTQLNRPACPPQAPSSPAASGPVPAPQGPGPDGPAQAGPEGAEQGPDGPAQAGPEGAEQGPDGPAAAEGTERGALSARLSALLLSGRGSARGGCEAGTGPSGPALPPADAAVPAAMPLLDGSLPSDADYAWGMAARAQAERTWVAAEWLGRALAAPAAPPGPVPVGAECGDGLSYSERGRLREAVRAAREDAARAEAAADAAALPPDVRAASGISPAASAADLYDAARAGWLAAASALPADVRAGVEGRLPIPARPARADGLLRRARAIAADESARAARPAVDVLGLALEALRSRPVPARPPAGWMGLDDDGGGAEGLADVDGHGAEEIDDDDEAGSGTELFFKRNREGDFAGVYHGEWRMLGNGPACSRGGEWLRLKGCMHEDHSGLGVEFDTAMAVEYACRRIDCPKCFEAAVDRKAGRVVNRLFAMVGWRRTDFQDCPARERIPLHCVLSAPESEYGNLSTVEGVKRANAFVGRRLAAMGLEGAVVFFHPFRFDKKNGGAPYYSPHFHVFALGWIMYDKVAALHAEDGWVFKKISVIGSVEHLLMAVRYVLSHVGVAMPSEARKKTPDVVRYFGMAGVNKFGCDVLLEAQHDIAAPIERVFAQRSRGKYPLLPAGVLQAGESMDGQAFVPIVSARLYEMDDKYRTDKESGRKITVSEFRSMKEDAAARVDGFELRGRGDFDRLLERLGGLAARDNPALRPINQGDVAAAEDVAREGARRAAEVVRAAAAGGDDAALDAAHEEAGRVLEESEAEGNEILDAARKRAAGMAEGARLPPARVLVVRVAYVSAGGAVVDGGGAGNEGAARRAPSRNNPIKTPRARFLVFILRPSVRQLCLICRRPLRVKVLDGEAAQALPLHEWPAGEPMLIPRGRIKPPDPEDGLIPIYSRKDGTADYDDRLLVAPPFMAAYPPHVQAAVRGAVERSEVSHELWVATGKRPSAEAVRAHIEQGRLLGRIARHGLSVDDRLAPVPAARAA